MAVTEVKKCDNHKENTEADNDDQKKMNNIEHIKDKIPLLKK